MLRLLWVCGHSLCLNNKNHINQSVLTTSHLGRWRDSLCSRTVCRTISRSCMCSSLVLEYTDTSEYTTTNLSNAWRQTLKCPVFGMSRALPLLQMARLKTGKLRTCFEKLISIGRLRLSPPDTTSNSLNHCAFPEPLLNLGCFELNNRLWLLLGLAPAGQVPAATTQPVFPRRPVPPPALAMV